MRMHPGSPNIQTVTAGHAADRTEPAEEKAAMWIKKVSEQLGHPTRSLPGWLISKFLKVHNRMAEESAVKLSGIQPGDTVLELGYGPGLGLEAAAKLLTAPTGKLIGVDYSEYMQQMASQRLKHLLDSGKLTLHLSDIAAMPLEDNTVDKVFHCNCYYFWPDLKKAATEIHRVMKPGGLMVTTLILHRLLTLHKTVPKDNWRPEIYMAALRDCGFTDVSMEDRLDRHILYQAIYAKALK